MKRTKFNILAAGAVLIAGILTSCSKNDTDTLIGNYPVDGVVRITTSLGDAQTVSRAATAAYTGADLSLSADYGAGDKYTRTNVRWNNLTGTWAQDLTADADPMLWKNAETPVAIYAFAPYTADATDLSAVSFSVRADQSAEGAILASDLVGYAQTGFVPGSSLNTLRALDIAFTHRLSKLSVNLADYGSQYPEGTRPTVEKLEVTNVQSQVTYNAATLTATAEGDPGNLKAATVKADNYEAIIVPQTVAASTKLVQITLSDGSKLAYTTPVAQLFEANKHYTLKLRVGKDKLEIGSVTVDDWTTGAEIPGGEAEAKISGWDGTRANSFAGGDGSEANPYLIEDASQLAYLATVNGQYGMNYKLCIDIDLNGREWIPIGSGDYQNQNQSVFSGTFDGDGHTIFGLKVTGTDKIRHVGLFGRALRNFTGTTTDIAVCNLNIKDAQVTPATIAEGQTSSCGILIGTTDAGYFDGKLHTPIVSNCHVSGTIYTDNECEWIGGIVGLTNDGLFKESSAEVTVSGGNGRTFGAFGGFILDAEIENCSASGSIEGKWALGGFIGETDENTIITNCTTSASVKATDWNVGGFIGFSKAIITGCSASGDVTSEFVWTNNPTYKTGGFVGSNYGTITNCSCTGTLHYRDEAQYYGGFMGYDVSGTTVGCRFDGSKNPNLAANGMSSINEALGTNDITNSNE